MMDEQRKCNNNSAETKDLETADKSNIQELENMVKILEKERDSMKKECDESKQHAATLEEKNNDLNLEKLALETIVKDKTAEVDSLATLSSKLRDQVECPVCLEVPTSGPVHCCPNGHFVCPKCKDAYCPTCRSKMFSGRSLLAVTVIENIEHKCRNDDCGELFTLIEYKVHLKSCPHRVIACPAPNEFCTKRLSLSKMFEHILTDCEGSSHKPDLPSEILELPITLNASQSKGVPDQLISMHGLGISWNGAKFYLNVEETPHYMVLSVQLLGDPEMCKDYRVMIAVHRCDDVKMESPHAWKMFCEPLPVDMEEAERKKNGLMIGYNMLDKVLLKKADKWYYAVTVDLKKKIM